MPFPVRQGVKLAYCDQRPYSFTAYHGIGVQWQALSKLFKKDFIETCKLRGLTAGSKLRKMYTVTELTITQLNCTDNKASYRHYTEKYKINK